MLHKRFILTGLSLISFVCFLDANPVRPLAQSFVKVYESPDAQTIPVYNPSIVRSATGRLIASYNVSGRFSDIRGAGYIVTSDDRGETWTERASANIGQTRLFTAGDKIYSIGSATPLRIMMSADDGDTWTEPVPIATGTWHQTASNFIHSNGYVYLALEKRLGRRIDAWPVGEFAPILLRGRIEDDLTIPENWTFSSELPFERIIPGYHDNELQIDFFGIPFYAQSYPGRNNLAARRSMSPMGWLETNVVQIKDPRHYWYDPMERTFHLLMRAHTGRTGYAAMAKVVEQEDGSMRTMLETVPSGNEVLFLPMPGGQMRFHILQDDETGLYWLLGSQATDSMTRAEMLPPERFGLPDNERHRMVLHFSSNLVDWIFAGVVAIGDSPKEARHYAAMAIDGDDLVILSRSGDSRARSAHDGNLITFHRVRDFRNLVY